MLDLQPFLTTYDPSDLPGGSIDPLGFDRGYIFLADKILPGLTNVANRPRYFSLLCAGAQLADQAADGASARLNECREHRRQCILRLERFWTLANVLAAQKAGEDTLDVGGIRGVRYVQSHVGRLMERDAKEAGADFQLLSRQMPYGVIGIYGAVSDGMRLIERDSLALTPDLGEVLADAFLAETDMPKSLRKAVQEDGTVSLATLKSWGERAHISGKIGAEEGAGLKDALQQDPTRWRMAALLVTHPWIKDDTELARLERVANTLAKGHEDADLLEGILAILAFERCYRLALLGFQRLLWRCRECEPYVLTLNDIEKDKVFEDMGVQLKAAYQELAARLRTSASQAFRRDLHRLEDVRRFLEQAALYTEPRPLVLALLQRHTDVQRAKIAGGRPKMPWLELSGEQIRPTIGQALRVDYEPALPEHITPHAYRVGSAQALLSAAGLV